MPIVTPNDLQYVAGATLKTRSMNQPALVGPQCSNPVVETSIVLDTSDRSGFAGNFLTGLNKNTLTFFTPRGAGGVGSALRKQIVDYNSGVPQVIYDTAVDARWSGADICIGYSDLPNSVDCIYRGGNFGHWVGDKERLRTWNYTDPFSGSSDVLAYLSNDILYAIYAGRLYRLNTHVYDTDPLANRSVAATSVTPYAGAHAFTLFKGKIHLVTATHMRIFDPVTLVENTPVAQAFYVSVSGGDKLRVFGNKLWYYTHQDGNYTTLRLLNSNTYATEATYTLPAVPFSVTTTYQLEFMIASTYVIRGYSNLSASNFTLEWLTC